jgi:hypothetical protein
MYVDEYNQVKSVIEESEGLEETIMKAYEAEGESLNVIVEGWLETQFKKTIQSYLTQTKNEDD